MARSGRDGGTSAAAPDEVAAAAERPDDVDEVSHRPAAAAPPAFRWTRVIVALIAVVALLGVGFAAGRVWPILTAPGDDSAEAGFARDMTVHHEQAVHMAMIEYDRGQNTTIRRMAYDVATNQQYQMGVMEGWLREWRLPLTSDQPRMGWVPDGSTMIQGDGRMPGMASTDELKRLEAANGKDADILFCQLMLRHHLGGVHMMDAVLDQTGNNDVREMAEQMRNAQQGEIEALRDLLTSLGAQPL
jgi:uncharacterized protein (DUF305 family)